MSIARDAQRGQALLSAVAESVYPIPDPMTSHEEYLRARHRDLLALGREALKVELARLRLRLLLEWGREPHPWLVERAQAIEERLRHAR